MDAGTTATSADNEILTISGQATASLNVTGGSAGDSIALGTNKDTVNAGAGNDTIVAGSSHTYEDIIDGGDGTDTIQATAAEDIDFQNTSNVEVLTATTSAALASFAQTAGIRTISLVGAASVNASGMTTGITVIPAAAANNSMIGGLGDDVFVFQATETLDANEVAVNGVAGNDTIRIDNDDNADKAGDAVTATLDDAVTNIDTVLVNDIASTDTAGDVTIVLAAAFAQKALTIDGETLDAGEVLDVDASNNLATELVTVKGGAGDDVVLGGAAADVITGNGGADTITGNGGADTLTGGAGADNFVYTVTTGNVTTDSTSAAKDTITDFTATSDNLNLTVSLANGGQTVDYNDKGDATSISEGLTLLSGVKGQYFFDSANSQVVFDIDGNGLIQSTDLVIALTGATGITESDVNITITGGTGADTITTGDGNDVITGGAAADSITITEAAANSAADTVKWTATAGAAMATESGAATGDTDFVAGTAGDLVTGFVSGTDKLSFAAAAVTNATGTETDTLLTIAAGGTVTNVARFVEITGDFGDGTTGDAVTVLAALDTTAVASGDSFIAFMNDGTNGYLFLVEEAGTASIAAAEVTLIGQVAGVTNVADGDFVSF